VQTKRPRKARPTPPKSAYPLRTAFRGILTRRDARLIRGR
jgi:hypothetical protein